MLLVPTILSGQDSVYEHNSQFPFIIVTKDTVTEAPRLTDEEFYRFSSGVIFKVNRTVIPANDQFMKLYRDSVLPWINSQHLQLRKVFIRGAASPEGPYANNQRLGKGRSKALLDELHKNLLNQYIETDADISCITEDYGYLCLLMKEAGDPDYQTVKNIYDECQGDELCCKEKLRAYNHSQLWNRLLLQYFPSLRASRIILWFSEPDSLHAPQHVTPRIEPIEPIDMTPEANIILPVNPQMPMLGMTTPEMPSVRRHVVAVRTNLVHDFFYMPKYGFAPTPNVQLEFYPWNGHMTFNMGLSWISYRHWSHQRFYQMRDIQLEVRRYFKGKGQHLGFYLGVAGEGTVYGIGMNKKDGWEGEGGAVSLTGGYVMPLTKRKNFRLEFMLAAGYFLTRHDPYVYGNPVTGEENGKYYYNYLGSASKFHKRNHTLSWFGPTNVGIQLTYDILYRKRHNVQQRIATGRLRPEYCY